MIPPQSFIETLRACGITFFTGVPCSFFRGVINYIKEHREVGLEYVLAPNEGAALAIASGAYLGGRLGAVMIQNSGLGNLINPLTSLNSIYDIPALLFVSGRAYGISDEPQHALMGERMRALLTSLAVEHQELPQEESGMKRALDQAAHYLKERKRPYIFIVKKGTFQVYENPEHSRNSFPMKRIDAIRVIASSLSLDDLIFSTTGKISRELFMVRDRPGNFYMQGSMGHIASLALGTALSKPEKRIVVLDGDGAFLMHMGAASSIGYHAPSNFYHLVLDNESYETTGDQDTASVKTDIAAVAKASGYVSAFTVESEDDLGTSLYDLWKQPGPVLLRIKINRIPTEGIPRITTQYQAPEITDHFMEFLGKPPSFEKLKTL